MQTFSTSSEQTQHILKSFNLTKTLFVSSILIGEAHIGKKSLIRHLFPNTTLVSGANQEEVLKALKIHDELIIVDFEKLTNQGILNFDNKRIIATANYIGNSTIIDELFAFIYHMPPLKERLEDVDMIKTHFVNEALHTFMIKTNNINIDEIPTNLSQNSKSLRKSVYMHLLKHSISKDEIEEILYQFLFKHLEGNDGYREYLGLYEKPLIQAGINKFGSQLKLSEVLGINRNTLRKKIHEHNIY